MIDESILRENDIRGVYGKNITEDVAFIVGSSFGTYLKNINKDTCVVGYDNRVSGEALVTNVIKGLNNTGINVLFVGKVTTPILNYATIKLNIEAGLMVTASHNPAIDNGFKLFGSNFLHLDHEELNKVYDIIKTQQFISGKGTMKYVDVIDDYIKYTISNININKRLKVAIDTGNGTVSLFIKKIMELFNLDVYYLNNKSDGTFPKHNPDPNVKENLEELINFVKNNNCDIGMAYDGDGDRLGIVDELGNIIETDKLLAFYARTILKDSNNKKLMLDVKCSKALVDDLKNLNIEPIMVKNGSAYIETQVFLKQIDIGGEYSGHVFFRDKHYGYDDGVYASLRVLEIISKDNKNLSEYFDGYKKYYNTPEIRIDTTDSKKWEIVDKIKEYVKSKNYKYIDIDGVRVEYSDAWALVRASNTSPQLSIRFEAIKEERLEEIKKEYMDIILELNKN